MRSLIAIPCTCVFLSCGKDVENEMPECLIRIIEVIKEKPVQSPKANIEKYLYNNQEVYLVNGQNFPDGQSHIITYFI